MKLYFISGTDWMESSYFFYGHYSGTYTFTFENGGTFDFPLFYFLVIAFIFATNLIFIVVSSSQSVKQQIQRNIDRENGQLGLFPIIFGSWDFNISMDNSIIIHQSDIFGKIQLTLSYLQRKKDLSLQSVEEKRKLLATRIFINVLILTILGLLFWLISFVTATLTPNLKNNSTCQDDISLNIESIDSFKCFALDYLPSITVTASNLMVPFFFGYLINFEKYEANTRLWLNLARCIFLRLASVLVALFALQQKVNCDYARKCYDTTIGDFVDKCPINGAILFKACSNENLSEDEICQKPICWETYVGQELYKLTLVDFLVQVCIQFISNTDLGPQ